jgi:penicillin G amidase
VLRAIVLSRSDDATDLLRAHLDPPTRAGRASGVDLAAFNVEALDIFKLAVARVSFGQGRLAAKLADAHKWNKVNDLGEIVEDLAATGSNNWAIHGSRTASGRAIVANDPHRAHAVPSLRYIVHLKAPGFDAIGAGEPAVPGISLGHNGTIAFGITIFCADQEDVYVHRIDERGHYRHGKGLEAMQVIAEPIPVKGEADQIVTLKFTRHGPVIREDAIRGTALAVKSVWFEPGSAAYLASVAAMRTRDFSEFRKAVGHWGAPSMNIVYGDVAGNIAWMPAGKMPRRPNWNGLLPVPGDGSHEWHGFLSQDELPLRLNPAEGFVATANQMNLPADWPHESLPVGFEWSERSRATRIHEVLGQRCDETVTSSQELQTDVLSVPARRLQRLLMGLSSKNTEVALGLAMLRAWDCRLTVDSAAAALFEVWWMKHLRPRLLRHMARNASLAAILAPGDIDGTLAALEALDARFGSDATKARDDLLHDTLGAAVGECRDRFGVNADHWSWGALHQGYFEHALSRLNAQCVPPMDVGPLPKGGSGSTPMHAGYRLGDFRVTHGGSVRMVMDVGAWDNSVCINAPGQSGDPRSPHYRDLAPLWAKGEYVPMLYSSGRIEPEITHRISLKPG